MSNHSEVPLWAEVISWIIFIPIFLVLIILFPIMFIFYVIGDNKSIGESGSNHSKH